jgi:CheY-like chemotaxis protein
VEDESFIAELLVKWLARLGAQTHWANNATQGIELFKAHADVICTVIADFRLPDMDGCDMCSRLRELKPGLPVLLTSGRYQGAAEQALITTGPTDFIQKPYPLDAALQKLQKLVAAV